MNRAASFIGALLGCLAGSASAALAAADADQLFIIEVSGTGDARFSGDCTVVDASGERRFEISGATSVQREVRGHRVTCSVTQSAGTGALLIEVRSPRGNVSRSRTTGAGSTVRLTAG